MRKFLLFIGFLSGFAGSLYANTYAVIQEDGTLIYTDTLPETEEQTKTPVCIQITVPNPGEKIFGKYSEYICAAGQIFRVDPNLIHAVIKVESNYNPKAVSNKGAKGLMQIMPINYQALDISDPFDPWQSIQGGSAYLGYCLRLFKGDVQKALASYHAGYDIVKKLNRIPNIPATRKYIKDVLNEYERLASN